ncbi:MAG: hypothetical protein AAFO96_03840 [Bacteroidota bacterium]
MTIKSRAYNRFKEEFKGFTNRVAVLVISKENEKGCLETLHSIEKELGADVLGVSVCYQANQPYNLEHFADGDGTPVIHLQIGRSGLRRPFVEVYLPEGLSSPGAMYHWAFIELNKTGCLPKSEDYGVLILDDKITLGWRFGSQVQPALACLEYGERIGVLQFAQNTQPHHQTTEYRRLVDLGGGAMFRRSSLLFSDLFGDSPMPIMELGLRMEKAYGARHVFYPYAVNPTKKREVIKDNGLLDLYPELLKKSNNRMGFVHKKGR